MQVIKFIINTSTIMETIAKEKQTNEETLLYFIHDFFDCRKLSDHLIFLDYWMGKVLVNQSHKKYLNASDLLFFSAKFSNLLAACYELHHIAPKNLLYFEESVKIPESFVTREQKALNFYPNYLRTKEICNPLLALSAIFKNHTLDFYKEAIQSWVNEGLASQSKPKNINLIFPTYTSLKRMIEACWLIHERSVSKNSYQSLNDKHTFDDFALSCPLLLQDEYLDNPYLMIELFFSFASLNEYKEDLMQWFKAALNEQGSYENPNDLLFIHNQFIQLIHSGYLIGVSRLVYEPATNYTKLHNTFGHWLLARIENQYDIQILPPHYRENPLDFCTENLTINRVNQLRYGLKEWLEAALSKKNSIANLNDHTYIFGQFEELQKIIEALFLLIIKPALSGQSSTTNIN